MALLNGCVWTALAGGTGPFGVAAAAPGFMSPAQAGAVDGTAYSYRAQSSDLSQWEIGVATSNSGGTIFTRAVSYNSTSHGVSNSPVNFTAAPTIIFTELVSDFSLTNITRASIPTINLGPAATIVTSGFATAGDLGAGAIYTSVGATSSGLMAIQDKAGNFFNLVVNGFINVGWCGATGLDAPHNDTAAIQTALNAGSVNGGGDAARINFTGSIADNILTVTVAPSIPFVMTIGATLWEGTDAIDRRTTIISQISGVAGGVGTYRLSIGGYTFASATIAEQLSIPIIVYFPPGTYAVCPPSATGVPCLSVINNNVTILLDSAIIKAYVSGLRDPNSNFDLVSGAVWRGQTFWVSTNASGAGGESVQNFRVRARGNAQITGQCLRQTVLFPYGGTIPPFPANPVTGNGWDLTHHAIQFVSNVQHSGFRLEGVEVWGYRGEILSYGGQQARDFIIRQCKIHDTNADIVNMSCELTVENTELYFGTNAAEESYYNAVQGPTNITFRNCNIHDCNNGIVTTNQTDSGTNNSGFFTITSNSFRNCHGGGVFVQNFARNVSITENTFIDCGTGAFGGVQLSMSAGGAGHQMNVFVDNNRFGCDTRTLFSAIAISDNTNNVTNKFIRNNVAFLTPNAIGNAFQITYGMNINTTVGDGAGNPYSFVALNNDFRACANSTNISNNTGSFFQKGNTWGNQDVVDTGFGESNVVQAEFDATSNTTVAPIPELTQGIGPHKVASFHGVLYTTCNASGGAKVSVTTTAVGLPVSNVRIRIWTGTTLKQSQQGTLGSFSLGDTSAVDSIEIDGYLETGGSNTTANIQVNFAQNAPFGTKSLVAPGSFINYREKAYADSNSAP